MLLLNLCLIRLEGPGEHLVRNSEKKRRVLESKNFSSHRDPNAASGTGGGVKYRKWGVWGAAVLADTAGMLNKKR